MRRPQTAHEFHPFHNFHQGASYFDKPNVSIGYFGPFKRHHLCLSKLQTDQLDKRIISSTHHFRFKGNLLLLFDIRNTGPSLGTLPISGNPRYVWVDDFPKDSQEWDPAIRNGHVLLN